MSWLPKGTGQMTGGVVPRVRGCAFGGRTPALDVPFGHAQNWPAKRRAGGLAAPPGATVPQRRPGIGRRTPKKRFFRCAASLRAGGRRVPSAIGLPCPNCRVQIEHLILNRSTQHKETINPAMAGYAPELTQWGAGGWLEAGGKVRGAPGRWEELGRSFSAIGRRLSAGRGPSRPGRGKVHSSPRAGMRPRAAPWPPPGRRTAADLV